MSKRRVLITGGSGYVAGRMLPALRDRYDLTILDVKSTNQDEDEIQDVLIADLLDRDRDTYREYFRGMDAVVHCGFKGSDEEHRDF